MAKLSDTGWFPVYRLKTSPIGLFSTRFPTNLSVTRQIINAGSLICIIGSQERKIRYRSLSSFILKNEIEYKKSSAVLVFNDGGELVLQLRAANDDSFPLHWDFSAGGGVDSGEDSKISAERELQEELGIKADVEFISQEHHKYPAWNPSITRETDLFIYKAKHNGPFSPDPKEVERVKFLALEDIQKMINSGHKFHPEFILSWEMGIITKAAINPISNSGE